MDSLQQQPLMQAEKNCNPNVAYSEGATGSRFSISYFTFFTYSVCVSRLRHVAADAALRYFNRR